MYCALTVVFLCVYTVDIYKLYGFQFVLAIVCSFLLTPHDPLSYRDPHNRTTDRCYPAVYVPCLVPVHSWPLTWTSPASIVVLFYYLQRWLLLQADKPSKIHIMLYISAMKAGIRKPYFPLKFHSTVLQLVICCAFEENCIKPIS